MLYRKIASLIEAHLQSDSNKILLIDGARQVGKTYIVRYVGQKLFENYIEINLVEDALGAGLFANVRTVEDFYLQVSMLAGDRMKEKENTLIFLDEIQAYPHLLTMLKFLAQDGRFTYIASGSLLGVTLAQTPSIPMGSIRKVQMFPLDFEEFLYANGLNEFAITAMRRRFEALEALDEATHNKVMDLFRKYLLVGGLPDAVNTYLAEKNIQTVREIQREIHDYYAADASKYGEERKLMIRRIYDLIPSNMENKKKRVVAKSIEDKKGKTFRDYSDEFEYLISAGIALPVQAISNPVFPLIESAGKNLLKLYLNDVGLLTDVLYGSNIRAILDDETGINLGSVYESVVAQELAAEGGLRTLKLCPFVLKRVNSFVRQREDQLFFYAGFKPRSETETGQLSLAADICRRGDAALILPAPIARACFDRGQEALGLKTYPLRTQGERWQLTVCYPRERTLSPAEQDFIQGAMDYYQEKQRL